MEIEIKYHVHAKQALYHRATSSGPGKLFLNVNIANLGMHVYDFF